MLNMYNFKANNLSKKNLKSMIGFILNNPAKNLQVEFQSFKIWPAYTYFTCLTVTSYIFEQILIHHQRCKHLQTRLT